MKHKRLVTSLVLYLECRARWKAREAVPKPVKSSVAAHQIRHGVGVPGRAQQPVRVDDVAEGSRVGHHLAKEAHPKS